SRRTGEAPAVRVAEIDIREGNRTADRNAVVFQQRAGLRVTGEREAVSGAGDADADGLGRARAVAIADQDRVRLDDAFVDREILRSEERRVGKEGDRAVGGVGWMTERVERQRAERRYRSAGHTGGLGAPPYTRGA